MKTTMKIMSCTVVLATDISGNALHGMRVDNATDMEIAVLQAIHGHERVKDIKITGEDEREQRLEMFRLARKYGNQAGIYANRGVKVVEDTFGQKLVGFDDWLANQEAYEQEMREEKMARSDAAAQTAVPAQQPAAAVKPAELAME